MMLYDNARNNNHKKKMIAGLYLAPKDIQKSENTSSIYAYVQVYQNEDYKQFLGNGWISLSSDNFIINNY